MLNDYNLSINEAELNKIVQQVLSGEDDGAVQIPQKNNDESVISGTVVLVPAYLPKLDAAVKALKAEVEETPEVYTLNGASFSSKAYKAKSVETQEERYALLDRLASAKSVLLLAPSIKTLKNIAEGDDEGFVENAVLKSVLWGRNVKVLLDFEPPKFKRGSFFETIVNAIDALNAMGIAVVPYRIAKDASAKKAALVTETEIIDAYNRAEKTIWADRSAIITPLAVDKARELNIHIEQG